MNKVIKVKIFPKLIKGLVFFSYLDTQSKIVNYRLVKEEEFNETEIQLVLKTITSYVPERYTLNPEDLKILELVPYLYASRASVYNNKELYDLGLELQQQMIYNLVIGKI